MTHSNRFGRAFFSAAAIMALAAGSAVAQQKASPAAAPAPAPQAKAPAAPACPAGTLGVSRTVSIDTAGGPGFGFEQYKAHDFLQLKEVVLTFDDGPQVRHTEAVLKALDDECTKATFFSIGKMALGMPEIIREVAKRGHTIGTHTWSHPDLSKKTAAEMKDEIEKGVSAVSRAVGKPISPFFRFPQLKDSKDSLGYLASRNMAIFSHDVDSFDFKFKANSAENLVKTVMQRLDKKGKGILLLHDVQPSTSAGIALLLSELKKGGYKIVHMKAAGELKTIAEYDQLVEKDVKGLPAAGSDKPTSSIVKTVE